MTLEKYTNLLEVPFDAVRGYSDGAGCTLAVDVSTYEDKGSNSDKRCQRRKRSPNDEQMMR